jgi:hypothetical protein
MDSEASLNSTQAKILSLAGAIASFAQNRCTDQETILVALEIAAKIVWRPSATQLADRASR